MFRKIANKSKIKAHKADHKQGEPLNMNDTQSEMLEGGQPTETPERVTKQPSKQELKQMKADEKQ